MLLHWIVMLQAQDTAPGCKNSDKKFAVVSMDTEHHTACHTHPFELNSQTLVTSPGQNCRKIGMWLQYHFHKSLEKCKINIIWLFEVYSFQYYYEFILLRCIKVTELQWSRYLWSYCVTEMLCQGHRSDLIQFKHKLRSNLLFKQWMWST